MRKIGLLLLATFLVISCKNETPVDYAILSGKVLNGKKSELTLSSSDRSVKETMKVSEEGNFIDTLKVAEGSYYLFDGKNRVQVYLKTGSEIKVDYDANDFKNSLNISGKGSEISNYLLESNVILDEVIDDATSFYSLNETEYKTKVEEIKDRLTVLITNYKGIDQDYKDSQLKKINYDYLERINKYEVYHAHYAKINDFKVSESFLNELEGLDVNNAEDFLAYSSYKALVNSHYRKKATELAKTEGINESVAMLKVAGKIENTTIKNVLLYDNTKYEITYTDEIEPLYTAFMEGSTDEENRKEITESYEKLKTLAKGQPSPKFVDFENFNGGTTSLDELKGKYVYVDVWATWCGPCKREIPSLKEVEKKYHEKNIEFVSISVDVAKDHDKWQKMVEEKELKGVQLFADKDWSSDFVQGYLIKGIPRFILIDPAGNIVTANAPRPSEERLIELFNELNI